jgi:O-antigen/teichoic acid export membrane protein
MQGVERMVVTKEAAVGRRLASGSLLRGTNLVATVLVSFFLTPFVIHHLGDRLNGLWVLVGTFVGYYGLLDLGLSTAVSRHVAGALGRSDQGECERLFSTALQLYSGVAAIALFVTFVAAALAGAWIASPQDASLAWRLILLLGINMALSLPLRACGGLLLAEYRFDVLAATELMCLLLRSCLVVCVLFMGYSVVALAWVTLLSGLPRIGAYVFFIRRHFPWLRLHREPWIGSTTKALFSYSVFSFISQIADKLRFSVDSFVITAYVSLSAVTHFSIAGSLVMYFIDIMTALLGVFHPLFSRLEGAGDYRALKRAFLFGTKISVSSSSFVGFGLIAWGLPFIQRWMGPSYVDAYPCLFVLALGYTVALWQVPSVNLLFAISKHKFYALANSVEGLANLALSLWLVGRFGILGVALGTFIPMFVVKSIVQPLYVCRVSKVPLGEYAREVLRSIGVVAVGLVIPALISLRFAVARYSSLVLVGMVCLACYSVVIWHFQFTKDEIEVLKQALLPSRVRGLNRATAAQATKVGTGDVSS